MTTIANHEALERILTKECAHPVGGNSEASIWHECRDYWTSQGEDRIRAGERAWLHINPLGGDCSYLLLTIDPLAVPPKQQRSASTTILTPDLRTEIHAEHWASYTQYCEHHKSNACKPSECEHVKLYHVRTQVQHELVCKAPYCGERFTASRRDTKYHSDACRLRAHRARPTANCRKQLA